MKENEGKDISKSRHMVLCSVCNREFYRKSSSQVSSTICERCGWLSFTQSGALLAEKEENQRALAEVLLKKFRSCSVFDLADIFKRLLLTAFNKSSPHCEQFFIKPGWLGLNPYTLRDQTENKDEPLIKFLKESTGDIIGKYQLESFNQTRVDGELISEAIPWFSCTRITSNAIGEENFSVLVLFHQGPATDVTQHVELLEKLMSSHNTDLGVVVTTEEGKWPLRSGKGTVNVVGGNQLANMMIDLEVGVKQVYKLYQVDDMMFFKF